MKTLDPKVNPINNSLPVVLNGCYGSRFHDIYLITACSMFISASAI